MNTATNITMNTTTETTTLHHPFVAPKSDAGGSSNYSFTVHGLPYHVLIEELGEVGQGLKRPKRCRLGPRFTSGLLSRLCL